MVLRSSLLAIPLLAWLFVACGSDSSGGAGPADGASSSVPTCAETCPGVVAAGCTNGPVDQADCVSGCESIRGSSCAGAYDTLFRCAGANPSYSCNGSGQVIVSACQTEHEALYTCLGI